MSSNHVVSFILEIGIQFLGKKWRQEVMWHLRGGPLRFSEIKRNMPACSVKVLSEVLVELAENHIIIRTQHSGIPVKVFYTLHPDTKELMKVQEHYIRVMSKYAYTHHKRLKIPTELLVELKQLVKS